MDAVIGHVHAVGMGLVRSGFANINRDPIDL